MNSFKADLPDGRYVVYLYWTELSGADVVDLAYQLDNIVQKEKATERLFHVDINGMRVLSSLDVAKEVGVRRPMICKIQQRYHDILELFHIHTSLNDFKIFAPQLFQESNVLSK